MSNAFLTADNIARTAAALVGQDLNLAALVTRDLEADFVRGRGATVKVRVPGTVAAQTRGIYDKTSPVVTDEIAEQGIEVRGHEELTTAPKGYARDHPRIELLRWKGVVASRSWEVGAWLGTRKAKDRVVAFLEAAGPLRAWLDQHVGA